MTSWHLDYCKQGEQKRAVLNLERQGGRCFYPQIKVEKISKGRCIQRLEPLFPCYLFVLFDPNKIAYTSIRSTRGVVDFVRQGQNA
ncbi:transcription termination/antitermination NusG family protein [Vibrio stylophorae]|uniref:transcription termination/antitermination NusG family protein n=1 Tax=Vibrio stylophorae TaxID=659351 RepID=UPI001F1764B4|nr:transcription termination/antitermination NusG family protein [Vibrio stylophorae]